MTGKTEAVFKFRSGKQVDVFLGQGWDEHFLFYREDKGWKVKDAFLPRETFSSITNQLTHISSARGRKA